MLCALIYFLFSFAVLVFYSFCNFSFSFFGRARTVQMRDSRGNSHWKTHLYIDRLSYYWSRREKRKPKTIFQFAFSSRLRTIIAALHCNILIRKDDLVRNLDYVVNILDAVQQDETRWVVFYEKFSRFRTFSHHPFMISASSFFFFESNFIDSYFPITKNLSIFSEWNNILHWRDQVIGKNCTRYIYRYSHCI